MSVLFQDEVEVYADRREGAIGHIAEDLRLPRIDMVVENADGRLKDAHGGATHTAPSVHYSSDAPNKFLFGLLLYVVPET